LATAALQSLERALPQLLLADLHLQEGGARQRLLKKFKRVIVVEDLNGVCDG
jgi:hypothetical protein